MHALLIILVQGDTLFYRLSLGFSPPPPAACLYLTDQNCEPHFATTFFSPWFKGYVGQELHDYEDSSNCPPQPFSTFIPSWRVHSAPWFCEDLGILGVSRWLTAQIENITSVYALYGCSVVAMQAMESLLSAMASAEDNQRTGAQMPSMAGGTTPMNMSRREDPFLLTFLPTAVQ